MIFILPAIAQIPPSVPGKDNPFILRHVDPKAPCWFAPEYEKVKSDKADPRVAYIELNAAVSGGKADFTRSCKVISQQTEDSVTVFDQKNGYLTIFYGMPQISSNITYFAEKEMGSGVVLYVDRTDEDAWTTHVFRCVDGKWKDESELYLSPLKLSPHDFFLAPEYGRTGRILTRHNGQFTHREWVTWDGNGFVVEQSAPGWRCPSSTRYLSKDEKEQFCRVSPTPKAAGR